MPRFFRELLPGIGLLVAVGLAARFLAEPLPGVNHLVLAIVLGLLLANLFGIPAWGRPGVNTQKLWLETGIVLMGAALSIEAVLQVGPTVLVLIVGMITVTILFVETISRNVFGLTDRLGTLLAAGTSICGVSAIIAIAGSIDAEENQIAYAVATILLFDAITLFAYPVVGRMLDLPDLVFGIWAGVSMFSTGPVAAAGFTYSEPSGQWATITKLTRNIFLSTVVIGYSVYYTRYSTGGPSTDFKVIWRKFPKFVLGFIAVMIAANVGVLSADQVSAVENAYQWFFLVAFAGLGMNIQISDMKRTGITPVLVVLVSLLAMSALSLSVILLLF